MCLHLLRYTWHCTSKQNIVLRRQYLIRIFHFFAAQMQVSQTIIEDLFAFTKYCEVVSQPLRAWKKGRALADITPRFDANLWTAIYFKSFLFLNSTHNSGKIGIRWYTDIAVTTSLSTILPSILLFDWATFLTWSNMRSPTSSIVHGTKTVRYKMVPNLSS